MADRASRGGETGMNGLHYDGGQFLPHTTLGKMTGNKKAASVHKVQIEPSVWVESREGMRPLMATYSVLWDWSAWRSNGTVKSAGNATAIAYYGKTAAEVAAAAERYSNGERWVEA
jgi:hypothetical protein